MTSQCSAAVAAALAALLVLRRRAGSSAALADFSEIASASAPLPSDAAELSALLLAERRAHARTEKRRIDERKGRRKAEMAVQKAALQSCGSLPEARYPILPIGTVRSCFIECGGVPRQAGLASETRAVIQFNPNVGPGSFDGLDLHSHVWVLFVFHHNTNAAKIARAHSVKGATFPSKITPPRAGKKIGVLATRTPHRPNPVGLTLCKLEAVDCMKRRVVLRGSDLVDGTPILDVKPYLPFADTPRESEGEVRIPAWTAAFQPPREVRVEAAAEVQLASSAVAAALRVFQGDAPRLRRALLQVNPNQMSRLVHSFHTLYLNLI